MTLITDDAARDVSRITGIPWSYQKVHQRGAMHPVIDPQELDAWANLQIAFAMIGANFWCDQLPAGI